MWDDYKAIKFNAQFPSFLQKQGAIEKRIICL
jgi:hypothetical protein